MLPDPVFMLAGGPGQAATDSYPQVAAAFREVLKKRNVILVDQRGTGHSNPLACKDRGRDAVVADDERRRRAPLRRRVAATLLSKHADLRFYTTTDAIRDLDDVRKAIGAAQVNLVGISYGTRVAQQYAMRYPHSTRTIVLDSVAPNTLYLGNEFAAQPRIRARPAVRPVRQDPGLRQGARQSAFAPGCVDGQAARPIRRWCAIATPAAGR